MVDILNAVLTDGLPAVEAACSEAIAHGVHWQRWGWTTKTIGQDKAASVGGLFHLSPSSSKTDFCLTGSADFFEGMGSAAKSAISGNCNVSPRFG
jgi:hypothetical protein